MKYEYEILNSPLDGKGEERARNQKWLLSQLNAFGKEHWDVVDIDWATGVVLLKREIP